MSANGKELIEAGKQKSLSIDLASNTLDLSDLSPEMRAEVQKYAAEKQVDLAVSFQQVKIDLHVTATSMNNAATVVRKMAESGDSVTLRQTINNAAGKVELLGGNTDESKKGVTTASIDRTWIYVVGGIAAAIIVAIILSK